MIRTNLLRSAAFTAALLGAVATASAQQSGPDTVVATINGKPVTLGELERYKQGIPQAAQLPTQAIYDILLDRVISSRLLSDAGYDAKLDESDAVKEQMQMIESQLVARALVDQIVENGMTEERVQKAYDTYVAENPAKDEVKASHILLDSKEKAEAVILELDAGADFAAKAQEKSIGPSAKNGGDLGFFSAEQMVKEFSDAAFALEKGTYTKAPVKSQFGWHVIKVFDRKAGTPPTLEEARPQIEETLGAELLQEHIDGLRESAKVETFNIDGSERKAAEPAAEQPKAAQ